MGRGAAFQGDGGPAKDALVNQPPHGVLDPAGNLFFIDQRNQRIRVIYNFATERENAIIQTVAGNGVKGFNDDGVALQTQFSFPAGAASCRGTGADGQVRSTSPTPRIIVSAASSFRARISHRGREPIAGTGEANSAAMVAAPRTPPSITWRHRDWP
jgi:hypothetical protein